MKRKKIVLIILGIIGVWNILLCILNNKLKINSIGIIGSADGPTSILITEAPWNLTLLYMGTGISILTFIIVCIIVIKKKK